MTPPTISQILAAAARQAGCTPEKLISLRKFGQHRRLRNRSLVQAACWIAHAYGYQLHELAKVLPVSKNHIGKLITGYKPTPRERAWAVKLYQKSK